MCASEPRERCIAWVALCTYITLFAAYLQNIINTLDTSVSGQMSRCEKSAGLAEGQEAPKSMKAPISKNLKRMWCTVGYQTHHRTNACGLFVGEHVSCLHWKWWVQIEWVWGMSLKLIVAFRLLICFGTRWQLLRQLMFLLIDLHASTLGGKSDHMWWGRI
jgi:hypothetical protein